MPYAPVGPSPERWGMGAGFGGMWVWSPQDPLVKEEPAGSPRSGRLSGW